MSLFSSTRLALKGTRAIVNVRMYVGESGSGAGKGGGGGGSIRSAGGSFGKMGAAHEDQYFNQKQKEQLKNLKGHLDEEIEHHRLAIKRHEEAIKRHEDQLDEMKKGGLGHH